jgi:putative DNA primase/helicase
LLKVGFWPVAIHPGQKRPIGKDWGLTRWDEPRLRSALQRYPGAGVGIGFGPGRAPGCGWLVDLEGDGDRAAESLAALLGGEVPDTPAWSSTRGLHHVFVADGDRLLAKLDAAGAREGGGVKAGVWHLPELPGLEIRVGGLKADGTVKQVQSVVPPTPGTDGKPRAWISSPRRGVAPLPEAAYALLERLAADWKKVESKLAARRGSKKASPNGRNAYAVAALKKECDAVEAATEGNRNNRLNAAAFSLGQLAGALALDRIEVERALLEAARRAGLGQGESLATIRSGIDAGLVQPRDLNRVGYPGPPPSSNGEGRRQPGDDRPTIEITTERHLVLEQALKVLVRDPDLYCRGDSLGIVVEELKPAAKLAAGIELRNALGSARFVALSDANVSCFLTRNARFYRWKTDRNGEPVAVDCHPPDWLVQAIASRGYWPGIRPLLTVTSCPFVRPDGSVPTPGYDEATGTLYRPNVGIPALPDRPTRQDARDAAKRLYHLVRQFPFASDSDRAVWLSALLTAIQRPMIAGPVPGFAFNGNKAGIGKGLLIDTIGVLAWGHCIPTRTYPGDPVEAGKVKLSIALAAICAVHFDNLPEGGFYGNSELDSALTSTQVGGRILGQSRETGPVPLRPLWTLSGNNVSPSRDAYRRWLPSHLRTDLESPHERDDLEDRDLLATVRIRRPELLRDALIILKAHAIADHPRGGWAPVGSFEEWDQVVRGAVWYATDEDCLTTQRQAAAESPERLEKLALLEGWSQLPDGTDRGLTVQDAIQAVEEDPRSYSMLHAAFLRMSRDGKMPNVKQIGNRIRAMSGQNIGGLKFQKYGDRDHTTVWRVAKA